jgi:polysaccharide export outer membrane protein
VLELSGPTNLLELISMAGGLREDAGYKLTINRKLSADGEQAQILNIDLQRLLETGDASLNIQIMDGDNLFIAKAGLIYIIGEVAKPGSYKYEDGATVLKIVSMAGDFGEFAHRGKIRIIRTVDGKEQILQKVSLQAPVVPGDVIEVPESLF